MACMELEISRVGALVGDGARARMLIALMDGRALPAGKLALVARVSPQTASAHLSTAAVQEVATRANTPPLPQAVTRTQSITA